MSCSAVICLLMAGIAIACSVIGTPLPFMRYASEPPRCVSAWGYKMDCNSNDYTVLTNDLMTCDAYKQRLRTVGAFQIIGIVGAAAAGVSILFGLICKKPLFKWLAIVTGLLGSIAFLIVVGIEGAAFTTDVCGTGAPTFRDQGWVLTSGFALVTVAWIVSMVYPIILCIVDPGFHD